MRARCLALVLVAAPAAAQAAGSVPFSGDASSARDAEKWTEPPPQRSLGSGTDPFSPAPTLREPRLRVPDRRASTLLFEWSAGAGAVVGYTILTGAVVGAGIELFRRQDDAVAGVGGVMLLMLPLGTALPIVAIAREAGGRPVLWSTAFYGFLAYLGAGVAAGLLGAGLDNDAGVVVGLSMGLAGMVAVQVWAANRDN